jgi:hypothetical protein
LGPDSRVRESPGPLLMVISTLLVAGEFNLQLEPGTRTGDALTTRELKQRDLLTIGVTCLLFLMRFAQEVSRSGSDRTVLTRGRGLPG